MEISVIIPVFNMECYLRECLESIINQTFKDYEIICIDNGSTDNSMEILREYANKYSNIIIGECPHECWAGGARNKGLSLAKGKYICFVDSDDKVLPDYLESLYGLMIEKDVDCVAQPIENFVSPELIDDSNIDFYYSMSKGYFDNFKNIQGLKTPERWTRNTFHVAPYAKLYKKSILDKYGIDFPEGIMHEDEAFSWEYFSVIKNIYISDEITYLRRLNNHSVMWDRLIEGNNHYHMFLAMEYAFNFFKKHKIFTSDRKNEILDFFDREFAEYKNNHKNSKDTKTLYELRKTFEKQVTDDIIG